MKRRGLSTIVGAVFFVLVMASTIGYVTYSMDLLDNLARQIDVKQDTNLNRQAEELHVSDVSINNNEFNLTVTNTGSSPVNITRMWAQNMTDSSWNQTKYQLNQVVSSGQSVSNIGIGTGLVANDTQSYNLRLTTERGNSLSTQILSASNQPLEMGLYVTPSSPLAKSNATLLFSVKNNLTAGNIIQSITPQINPPNVTGAATAQIMSGPSPASVQGLAPGEMVFFEWEYYIEGDKDDQITYNTTVANSVIGNFVTDTTQIATAPVAEESILSIVSGSSGLLFMNFTTFEACDPASSNCRSTHPHWTSAWELESGLEYLFRVNVTNHGGNDIFLEERTAMVHFPTKDGSANINKYPAYIRADSTQADENPGAYTNWGKNLLAGETSTIYFGSEDPPGGAQEDDIVGQYNQDAIVAIMLVIFGSEDDECTPGPCNGHQSSDPPYSQTIPFQAFTLTPP